MALLQPQLDSITAQTRKLVPAERLEPAERAIAEAQANPAETIALGVTLPSFKMPDASGHPVRSEDLLALAPVILKFFRGRWDPYCSTELEVWRDLYPQVRAMGGLFIAVSPQAVRQNDFLAVQHALPFPILRDAGCEFAHSLGLAQHLPEYLQKYYRSILVNIPFLNGEPSWNLPLAATLIAERHTGTVRYIEAYPDFRVRPEPQRALEVLAAL